MYYLLFVDALSTLCLCTIDSLLMYYLLFVDVLFTLSLLMYYLLFVDVLFTGRGNGRGTQ